MTSNSSTPFKRLIWTAGVLALATLLSACAPTQVRSPQSPSVTDEALYQQATSALKAQQYQQSGALLSRLLRDHPFSPRRNDALLGLAFSALQLGQPATTVELTSRVIEAPAAEGLDYAYYLRSSALLGQQPSPPAATRQAATDLQQLRLQFPNSRYRQAAAELETRIFNQLAAIELAAASQHLQQGDADAAINRCRYLIETYPGSHPVAEALTIMETAYNQLGLTELARATAAIARPATPQPAAHPTDNAPQGSMDIQ